MGARRRELTINSINKRKTESQPEADNGELTEPLSPAARLFQQPNFNCHIAVVMAFAKRIDVDAFKAGLQANLLRHPRFYSVPVPDKSGKGKDRWLPTKVVIDDHIVVPNLEIESSDLSSGDRLVEKYMSYLSTTTLPLSRPLWDVHFLNVRTTEAEAVALIRIHHSLGDGMSLMSLLLACTRKTSDRTSLPSLPESRRLPSGNGAMGIRAFIKSAWVVLVLLWHTLVDVLLFLATVVFLKDTKTPLEGKDGVEFHPKLFVHRSVSLDDLKVVKNVVGCTINDVLIGVTSAGLSRYLSRRSGETDDGKEKKIRLRATVIINVRPSPGIHALAEMIEGRGGARWGNKIGYAIFQFPIAMYKDPLEYIRKGKEVAERKKNSLEAIFTYASGLLVVKLFGIKAATDLCARMLRNTTVSFSNIVGPTDEVEFCGHPVVFLAPTVYGHPQAVTFHFQSYMNKMKMVLAVDELTVPDPKELLDDLVESLKLIKDAAVRKSS